MTEGVSNHHHQSKNETRMEKEKRVSWASEHITDDFADVVGTDESMIQQENHRTFCYRKRGTAPKAKSCHFV